MRLQLFRLLPLPHRSLLMGLGETERNGEGERKHVDIREKTGLRWATLVITPQAHPQSPLCQQTPAKP